MEKRDKNIIPLFPLEAVLFPDSTIRLHIFEEKYKKMISDCIQNNTHFGICLKEDGKISYTGSTAKIIKIEKEYPDGKKDILVTGETRFLVKNLYNYQEPYLLAEIALLTDRIERENDFIKNETIVLYNELIKIVYKGSIDVDNIFKNISFLSFRLAEKIGMTLFQRQQLLEVFSEPERIKIIYDYLIEVIPKVKEFDSVQTIIRNDGYL